MADAATGLPQMLAAYLYSAAGPMEIVIAGAAGDEATGAFVREVHRRFLPNKILLLASAEAARFAPWIETMIAAGGPATAYVCENHACRLPTADLDRFAEMLGDEPHSNAAGMPGSFGG
jgi:hypothetical protein